MTKEFFAKVDRSIILSDLSNGAFRLYSYILTYAGCEHIFVSQSYYAKILGVTIRTILRYLNELESFHATKRIKILGRRVEIILTPTETWVKKVSDNNDTNGTLIDKMKSNSSLESVSEDDLIVDILSTMTGIIIKGRYRKEWEKAVGIMRKDGIKVSQIEDIFDFIEENAYWRGRILTAVDLLKKDKGGISNYQRIIREMGSR